MVRFALVQVGDHAEALLRVATRLRGGAITAVVEADPAVARRRAEQLGAAVWATSTEQLHQQHDDAFDAWVASPRMGLLIAPHEQRPLDLKNDGWLSQSNTWLWGHAFRFLPSVATVRESVAAGKLGATGLVHIHHWQPRTAGEARAALLPQLDLACWLVEQQPTQLFAQTRPQSTEYVQVHLGFADDRMAVIDCATSLAAGDDYYALSVIGAAGAAYADDHRNVQLHYGGGSPRAIRTSQGDKAILATLQEFIDAVAQRRAPTCSAPEWKRAHMLLAAVERSLVSQEAVALAAGGAS